MKQYKQDGSLTKNEQERRRIRALPRPSEQALCQPRDRFEVPIKSTKYSECGSCGHRIDPGDPIYWIPSPTGSNKSHARHRGCPATPAYREHLTAALEDHRGKVERTLEWVEGELRKDPILRGRLLPPKPQKPTRVMTRMTPVSDMVH